MADDYIRKAEAIKQCGFGMTSLHIADNLRKMRPADVVQVVHGHWVDVGSLSCRCDQCGCKSNKQTRFCPNCGAKMDA